MAIAITKAEIKKLEAKGKDGRMLPKDWLGGLDETTNQYFGVWLNPKYGHVGQEFTYSKGPKAGQVGNTTSFNFVTSGFNEATPVYYGVSPIDFLKNAEEHKLVTLRPAGRGKTGKGVSGVRVYPYSDTTSRGADILASMGLKPKS